MGFQEDFVRAIYQPRDAAGHRLVQQAVLSTARRNGKSLLMALFVLTHLAGPARRLNSMMLSGANDRFQAAVVFDHIAAIIMMEPRLAFLNVIQSTKRIFNPRTNSVYIAISAEAVTKLGRGPEVVVYDELGSARNRQLYDVLVSGQGATLDPLMVNISTQAQARTHLFSELIDYGAKVATGEIRDPSFVCHLHAAQPGCSLLDEREWKKANPALGKWRSMTEMRTKAQQASLLPSLEPMFRNLYLNQRVDSISPMIPPMIWDACGGAPELEALRQALRVWRARPVHEKRPIGAGARVPGRGRARARPRVVLDAGRRPQGAGAARCRPVLAMGRSEVAHHHAWARHRLRLHRQGAGPRDHGHVGARGDQLRPLGH